jgi:hypothetical protein
MFLIERALNIDEWLAAKGYQWKTKPGYLGLSFDVKSGRVSREGCPHGVRLGKKLARLFNALLHAGPTGLDDYMLNGVYPGTLEARRRAKTDLRQKLDRLGITIARGGWRLEESSRGNRINRRA